MATTYTDAEVFWGSGPGQHARIFPTGADYKSAIVTFPAAETPYFSVILTRTDDTTVVVASHNFTIVRPG